MTYVDVIFNLALPKTFTYLVPQDVQASLQPGQRVFSSPGEKGTDRCRYPCPRTQRNLRLQGNCGCAGNNSARPSGITGIHRLAG